MNYREYVFKLCSNTDFKDEEEAVELAQYLASEAIRTHELCMEYECKLKELMSAKDYEDYIHDVAKRLFRQEIEGMADGEFKDYVLEHFEEITE